MLNRKYADSATRRRSIRGSERYDPGAVPQAVLRLGPACRPRVKGGYVLGSPGLDLALSLFRDPLCTRSPAVYDEPPEPVLFTSTSPAPAEDAGGMLSFLDLKLDLVVHPSGAGSWSTATPTSGEVAAGTISPGGGPEVGRTVERSRKPAPGRLPSARGPHVPPVAASGTPGPPGGRA